MNRYWFTEVEMLTAWHGNELLKQAALERLREHRLLGEIVRGTGYWNGSRGCWLGCLTHSRDAHESAERLLGISIEVSWWIEAVFENLPHRLCTQWAIDSIEAIPVGADLSQCEQPMTPGHVVWESRKKVDFNGGYSRPDLWKDYAAESLKILRAAPIVQSPPIPVEILTELRSCGLWLESSLITVL